VPAETPKLFDPYGRPVEVQRPAPRRIPLPGGNNRQYYEAAEISHLLQDWWTTGITADEIIHGSAQRLRNRARALERENGIVRRYLSLVRVNVFGWRGIQFESNANYEHRRDRPNRRLNETLEEQWELFGKLGNYDVTGKHSCLSGDVFAMRRAIIDGECFIHLVRGFDNPWRFAVQFLEAEMIDADHFDTLPNGNQVVMGIELDHWGRARGYYLRPELIGNGNNHAGRVRIDARDMIHLAMFERNQTRAVPWITSGILQARQLGEYEKAEVTTARVAAAKMGFIESAADAQPYSGAQPDELGNMVTEVAPGVIEVLGVGQTFRPFNPGEPHTDYPNFRKAMIRGLACAFDVGYNALAGDLESVNYSSLRTGDKHDHEIWRYLQGWYIENARWRIFEAWLETAAISGAIDVPGFEYSDIPMVLHAISWKPRGWDYVDPTKDSHADVVSVANKMETRTNIAARKGYDLEDIFATLAAEEDLAEEYGLDLTPVGISGGGGGKPPPSGATASGDSAGAGTGEPQQPSRKNLKKDSDSERILTNGWDNPRSEARSKIVYPYNTDTFHLNGNGSTKKP
jgi:lambda family phage portal protein